MPSKIYYLLLNEFFLRRSCGPIFGAKTSFIISGAILFLALNISVAKACLFLWWKGTELSFFSRSWNEDDLYRMLFSTLFHAKNLFLLLRPRLWNIQAKGQYTNWDNIYAFITVFLCLRQMHGAILANALSFWLALFFVVVYVYGIWFFPQFIFM